MTGAGGERGVVGAGQGPERAALAGRTPGLAAAGLIHCYAPGAPPVVALDRLEVEPGEAIALTGPSGSGKTTLAHLLTGIEPVRSGSVRWETVELAGLPERRRDDWRRHHVGLVFQDFHLVPGLSIEANVLVSCYFDRLRPSRAERERARRLLDGFGVPTGGGRRGVADLSRGEQQRIAIARALVREPSVVVADEPTASLDAAAGARVIELLLAQAREAGATLVAVTHDPALIDAVDAVYRLERGRLARVR